MFFEVRNRVKPVVLQSGMDEETKQLLLDIQRWMMDNDYEESPSGRELFNRISELTGVNWDGVLKATGK